MTTFSLAIRSIFAVVVAVALSLVSAGSSAETNGPAKKGPQFQLVDQHGRTVNERDLSSKPTILHFGFTGCPMICPTTLYEIGEYMRELGSRVERFNFVFVTVDPERDAPEILRAYLDSFDGRILGLTGSASSIKALADGLGAIYTKRTRDDGAYTYDHTIYAYLLSEGWMKQGHLFMGTGARRTAVLERLDRLSQAASR